MRLTAAGWTVTNQHVFTAASSRRGHTNRLRQVLNDTGVLAYYTFSVKGFMENTRNYATIARAVQEQVEEKYIGRLQTRYLEEISALPGEAEHMTGQINSLRIRAGLPFLATDRSVINLPGVGKSMTFRVIGITRYGRRIFGFEHDATRAHSPIIHKTGKVIIIESKSVLDYLRQLESFGEEVSEYESIWGYTMGETEPRMPLYEYPEYDFNQQGADTPGSQWKGLRILLLNCTISKFLGLPSVIIYYVKKYKGLPALSLAGEVPDRGLFPYRPAVPAIVPFRV